MVIGLPCIARHSLQFVPKVGPTPGSISVAVDRLEQKGLVKRKNTDDRRVRRIELTANGRTLITKTFREHAAAMERSRPSSQERSG